MLGPEPEQRRRGEPLGDRTDIELGRQSEPFSDLGRVRLLEKHDAVLRYENDARETAISLRPRNGIEPRAALRRRGWGHGRGREEEQQRPDQSTRASAVRIAAVTTDFA